MNKKKNFFFAILLFSSFQIFAIGKIYYENGGKIMHSTFNLKESDFEGSDFFIKDIPSRYYKDFNAEIFNIMTKNLQNGELYKSLDFESLGKKKGSVVFTSATGNDSLISYAIYNKKQKGFLVYRFTLSVDNEAYEIYRNNLAYYEKCIKNIEWCNWALENCASPTIQKSRVVQVPYTAYEERVEIGQNLGGSGRSYSIPVTRYRLEREYYDVQNPNYSPENVAYARKNLPLWERDKVNTEQKLQHLPFRLENFKPEE